MTEIPRLPVPTWFVGCGNMGQAIVGGWRAAGIDLSSAVVIRPSGMPVTGVRTVTSVADAGAPPRMVVLGFKPQKLVDVAPLVNAWVTGRTTIVSLLAGVEVASLRKRFPGAGAIVRAMPNLPVAIRRGVVALYGDDADEKTRVELSTLFAALGFAPWMADEAKFSAVGAVAGSGPAYVARFIAALTRAGEARGLSNEIASTIALETVLGTSWLAASDRESMEDIARRVASPKGTTEAGLAVLDERLGSLVDDTLDASAERGRELAEAARLS